MCPRAKKEVRFYYDSVDRNFNIVTEKTLQDKIAVLSFNTKPDSLMHLLTI